MKGFKKIVLAFLSLFLFFSCKKKNEESIITDYRSEYFPLVTGSWIIYDVDSTTYNDIDTPAIVTKVSYQLREKVDSSFSDAENRLVYRIERERKNTGDSTWQPFDACYAYVTSTTAERVEDNLRFIKLVFPPVQDKKWNGNTYINATAELAWYANWEYQYTGVYEPASVGGLYFSAALNILQVNDTIDDLTKMKYATEVYAKDVGLIYKKVMKLESQQLVFKPWLQKAEKGFIMEMRISDYKR